MSLTDVAKTLLSGFRRAIAERYIEPDLHWTIQSKVKNQRYCELLFVRSVHGSTVADVYNTFGLNHCPANLWKDITPANAKDNDSIAVVLNGPRYWAMDEFETSTSGVAKVVKNVGGIDMALAGHVPVVIPLPPSRFYEPNLVTRNATFRWKAGSIAYFLTRRVQVDHAVTEDHFIMQSSSQQVLPDLDARDLRTLVHPLLPFGWTYRTRRLTKSLNVTTPALVGGRATVGVVIQDEFQNSYSYVGDVDAYLARPKSCTRVSVDGDATYCIVVSSQKVCSGSGESPAGDVCPLKGALAAGACRTGMVSFHQGNCIAPSDGKCQKLPSGPWGCVWPSARP
ncbi:hypothetical protein H310_09293 [Aphanomyces invadans]|uniref:Uncharacterized protein n=1 Tax=Aphanomyces invadans TaxID=157072 RepID=A0A024TVJ2_9STRA|nr:hypothetical protein H310_09293 [Aphanomyces invadans]ETV97989.1 hypothetical protein H310_09293 [Aphanomyces invadans]|eukprot:XP_008873550.1 hypothetical protein H310_09293 [Aphanomyces invadans]